MLESASTLTAPTGASSSLLPSPKPIKSLKTSSDNSGNENRKSIATESLNTNRNPQSSKCPFEANVKEIYSKLIEIDDQHNRDVVYEVLFSDNVNLEVQNRIDCSTQPANSTMTATTSTNAGSNVNNKQTIAANKQAAATAPQAPVVPVFSNRMLDFSDWNDGIGEWNFVNPYPCMRNYVSGLGKRRSRNKDPIDFDEELGMFVPASIKPKPVVVVQPPAAVQQISHYSSQTSSKHLDSLEQHAASSFENVGNIANKSIPPLNTSFTGSTIFQYSPVAQNNAHQSHTKDQKAKDSSRTSNHHNPSLNTLNNPIASERLLKELQKIIESNTAVIDSNESENPPQLNPTCYKKKLSYPGDSYRPDSASMLNGKKMQLPIKAAALPFSEYYNVNSTLATNITNNTYNNGSLSSHIDTSDLKFILNGHNQTSYRLSNYNGVNLTVKSESESNLAIVAPLNSKKVLPPVIASNSSSTGNSSHNNTLLSPNIESAMDNPNNTNNFYRNILGQNLLSNKNGENKTLTYNQLKHGSNSNLLFLDEDGEPVMDSDKNSFFYINSIGKNNPNARAAAVAAATGSKSYKPYKMRPNTFKNQNQSSSAGAYSSSNNMNYLTNQVLASNDLLSHSGSISGQSGATTGTGTTSGGGLPPLIAGKRIQMPLGPHRWYPTSVRLIRKHITIARFNFEAD